MPIMPSPLFLTLQLSLFALGVAINHALLRALKLRPLFTAIATAVLTLWLVVAIDFGLGPLLGHFHWVPALLWVRAAGYGWIVVAALATPVVRAAAVASLPGVDAGRRRFIQAAGFAAVAAPLAAGRVGFLLGQREAMIKEVDLPIANLPHDLDGFRIVQISDIHMSPFLG